MHGPMYIKYNAVYLLFCSFTLRVSGVSYIFILWWFYVSTSSYLNRLIIRTLLGVCSKGSDMATRERNHKTCPFAGRLGMTKKEHIFGCLILVIQQKISEQIQYIYIRHICTYWCHSFIQSRLFAGQTLWNIVQCLKLPGESNPQYNAIYQLIKCGVRLFHISLSFA